MTLSKTVLFEADGALYNFHGGLTRVDFVAEKTGIVNNARRLKLINKNLLCSSRNPMRQKEGSFGTNV